MRESRRKMSDNNEMNAFKHVKKCNKLNVNKKKIGVNRKITVEGVAVDIDTDSGDMQSSRTCDSPVKSEYSEEGSGTDLSASSSITGGNGSQSSGGRSNQSPSTPKKSGIPGITFQPGTRLEAKDLGNGIWYAVKVVEVDWEEDEILIHFEKWSQRYDEWVPMDSSRLRPVMEPPGGSFAKKVAKIFKVGDKVMATWSDSRKYPATVKTVLGNDRYEVLFFDGFSKTIKGGRMIPLKDEELAKIQKLQPGIGPSNDVTNAPPVITDSVSRMISSPMAAALGTKEERRERKRKLNVAELFHFKKRPRLDSPSAQSSLDNNKKTQRGGKFGSRGGRKKGQWPHEISTLGVDSSSRDQVKLESHPREMADEKHLGKVEENAAQTMENRKRENVTKGRGRSKIGEDTEKTMKRPKSEALGQRTDEEGRAGCGKKIGRKFTRFREGGKRAHGASQARKDKGMEDSEVQRGRKKDGDGETGKPARVTDDWEPIGEPAYIIDGTDGPRKSIIVADPRIPPGWTRHTIQRMSGHSAGKWDVFFVCPEGRKFRTRHELRLYYEEHGEMFPSEQFDFSLGRRKNKTAIEANNVDSTSTAIGGSLSSSKMVRQTTPSSSHVNLAMTETSNDTPIRRVKTLLPRVRPPNMEGASSASHVPQGSDPLENLSSISDGSVVLGGLKIQKENDAFRCPKEGCNKNFRKENLLQMHMKHYHPEYNRFVASTPNVADLAYARTVGERLEELHPRTPRPSILEKISRFEALRRARANPTESRSSSPPLPSSTSCSVTPSESPIVSLSPLASVTSRTSPVSSHRRTGDADPLDGPPTSEISGAAESPRSPSNIDSSETPHSAVRTLMPVVRLTAADIPVQGISNDVSGNASVGQGEMNAQSTEVSQALEDKMEDRDGDTPTSLSVAGVSHTKSLRMVRRRHMSDFHMEPLLKKRKSDAEESSQSAVVNGNVSRQTRTESLRREELINCTCGYPEEDGLMIQCDLCMCWQHGLCNNIEHEDHVPEKYVCYICLNPPRERRSKHFLHDQDWLKEGRLPSLSFRSKNAIETARCESMFKHSHELTGSLLELQNVIHSLRVKVNIAEKKDHPKLYLWAQSWEKSGNNSQNQSLIDIHGNNDDDQRMAKNEFEDAKEITAKQKDANETMQLQSSFPLPSYDSTLCKTAQPALNLVGEANEIGLPSESVDLLADECDTKDTCFSQETSGSARECDGMQNDEKKPAEEPKTNTPQVAEGVVLDNNIDIGTETEVATAEVEVGQEEEESSEVKEENIDGADAKEPESSSKEQSKNANVIEKTTTNLVDTKLNCSKMETDNLDDEDDELQLSLGPSGLVDIPSSENPVNSDIVEEPLKKFVPCVPQPEAPIDPAECRLTLLDHIDHLQHKVEARLVSIESQIKELENADPSDSISDARTKETVQMLLRDLAALYDIAAFN